MLDMLAIVLPPIAAFAVGTCTPALVRRFSFEGFEARQLSDYIVISETDAGGLVFSTVLKMANGTARTLILSEVNCPAVFGFELQRLDLQRIAGPIVLPPVSLDYPPLAVPPDSELILGLAVWFRKKSEVSGVATDTLQSRLAEGYRMRIRVNGKSRYLPLSLRVSNL